MGTVPGRGLSPASIRAALQERSRRRFVFALMIGPYTLPMLGASLLAAVTLGVHLGESSVGLIDPVHFQGPAIHPRDRGAAIDESRLPPRGPAYAELYGWEKGAAARAADCGDCEALRARAAYARDYSAEVPWFGGPAPPRRADVSETAEAAVVIVDEPAPEEAEAIKYPVERYAHYPVAAGEIAEPADVPPPDEPDQY